MEGHRQHEPVDDRCDALPRQGERDPCQDDQCRSYVHATVTFLQGSAVEPSAAVDDGSRRDIVPEQGILRHAGTRLPRLRGEVVEEVPRELPSGG